MSATEQPQSTDLTILYSMISIGCVAAAFSAVALFMVGARSGLGVAVGGAIAVLNLAVFSRVVRGLLGGGRHRRLWVLVGIVKIFVLFGGVWWLLHARVASGLAMVIGYGAMPLGIAIGGLIAPKPGEDDGAAAARSSAAGPQKAAKTGARREKSDERDGPDSEPGDSVRASDAERTGFPASDLIRADSQSEDSKPSGPLSEGPESK